MNVISINIGSSVTIGDCDSRIYSVAKTSSETIIKTGYSPRIGDDGYWYVYNDDTNDFEKTEYKADVEISNKQIFDAINSYFVENPIDYIDEDGVKSIISEVLVSYYTKEQTNGLLSQKVDKVEGKVLSSNDYTDADKNKVANALTSYTETDPTVPQHVKNITVSDIENWNGKTSFDGNYNSLSNKPTIPTVPTSEISANTVARHTHANKSVIDSLTADDINVWNSKSDFSGSYNDLSDKPSLFDGDYNSLDNKPDIPSVPTEEIRLNTDSRHSHANKVVLDGITQETVDAWNGKSDFSGDYNDLINKPTIPTVPTSEITANTQARHTHNNKAILDKITKEPIYEHQSLEGYATEDYVDDRDDELRERIAEIELSKFPNVTIFGTPTIQQGQVSNFSLTNYLEFPFLVDFKGRPFEINFMVTMGNDIDNQQNILDSAFGLAFAIRNKHFVIAVSYNGTSWALERTGTLVLEQQKTYMVKISWSGLVYSVQYSVDGGNTYVNDIQFDSTSYPFPKQMYIGTSKGNNFFKGIINLNYADVFIGSNKIWQGMDDAGLALRADINFENITSIAEDKIGKISTDILNKKIYTINTVENKDEAIDALINEYYEKGYIIPKQINYTNDFDEMVLKLRDENTIIMMWGFVFNVLSVSPVAISLVSQFGVGDVSSYIAARLNLSQKQLFINSMNSFVTENSIRGPIVDVVNGTYFKLDFSDEDYETTFKEKLGKYYTVVKEEYDGQAFYDFGWQDMPKIKYYEDLSDCPPSVAEKDIKDGYTVFVKLHQGGSDAKIEEFSIVNINYYLIDGENKSINGAFPLYDKVDGILMIAFMIANFDTDDWILDSRPIPSEDDIMGMIDSKLKPLENLADSILGVL